MRHRFTSSRRRLGFTLLELLVVIAIIGVLLSLTGAAVMQVYRSRQDAQNTKDIFELDRALHEFKVGKAIYPPSLLLLSNDPKAYEISANDHPEIRELKESSVTALAQIWGNLRPSKVPVDWSAGQMKLAFNIDTYALILEGDQCLVFFIGGVPNFDPPACRGFSNLPSNPFKLDKLQPPPFHFEGSRLIIRPARMLADPTKGISAQPTTDKHVFFSYLDAYGVLPFAYFSSDSRNGRYGVTDCLSLGILEPYFKTATPTKRYMNAESFQLISAGRDRVFAPGGQYVPDAAVTGIDDLTNFSQ